MPVYIIEGCVATGKSTVCKSLVNYLNSNGHSDRESIFMLEQIPQSLLNLYLQEMEPKYLPSKSILLFFNLYILTMWRFDFLSIPLLAISFAFYVYFRYQFPVKHVNKYAFPFQTIIIRNRIEIMKKAIYESETNNKNVFIDRGIVGDMSFAQMQFDEGIFTKKEYSAYLEMISDACPSFIPLQCFKNHGIKTFVNENIANNIGSSSSSNNNIKIVYLKCNPSTALYRLKKRGNENEIDAYSREYLQKLIDSHDKIIGMFEKSQNNFEICEVEYNCARQLDETTQFLTDRECERLWQHMSSQSNIDF